MNYAKLKEIEKSCFGYEDVAKALKVTPQSAKVACTRLAKKRLLIRIKRNKYLLKDKWDALTREDTFALANIIQTPSYISLMTAMDYHELTTHLQREFVESIAIYRTKEIEIEEKIFNYTKIKEPLYFGFYKEKGFFIAYPEKAFLDAVYLMSLKRYSFDLTSIDFNKLNAPEIKRMLKRYPEKTKKLIEDYGHLKKA